MVILSITITEPNLTIVTQRDCPSKRGQYPKNTYPTNYSFILLFPLNCKRSSCLTHFDVLNRNDLFAGTQNKTDVRSSSKVKV